MTTTSTPARTYRGTSLEELIPRIREELGPDAVITKRREGIVGGIAGFFGKRCVEVEARAGRPAVAAPAVPAEAVVRAYRHEPAGSDEGEKARVEDREDPRPTWDDGGSPPLMEALRPEGSLFSPSLVEAVARESRAATGSHPAALRAALLASAFPSSLAEEVLGQALRERQAFDPEGSLAPHVRRALALRLRSSRHPARRRRRIALIGPPGAGRTLVAAKLCQSYARSGAAVAALSLEPVRRAAELAALTDCSQAPLAAAESPAEVALALVKLRLAEVIVADTPAVHVADPESLDRLGALLAPLRPTEGYLVLPRGVPGPEARPLLRALRSRTRVDGIVLTREEEVDKPATPVGVAAANSMPVAYLAYGKAPDIGIRPASAEELARLVVP